MLTVDIEVYGIMDIVGDLGSVLEFASKLLWTSDSIIHS